MIYYPDYLSRYFSVSIDPKSGERSNNVWIYNIKPTSYCKEIIDEYKRRCPDDTEPTFAPTDPADYHQTAGGRKISDTVTNIIYNYETEMFIIATNKPVAKRCYLTIIGRFRLNLKELPNHQPLFGPPVEVNYGRYK